MAMKMVTAIIRPEKFEAVKRALEEQGIYGMTVSEVRGRGEQKGIALKYRGRAIPVDLIPKLRLDLAVRSGDADLVIRTIKRAAWTGKFGDGRIFVMPVESVTKVRTDDAKPPER